MMFGAFVLSPESGDVLRGERRPAALRARAVRTRPAAEAPVGKIVSVFGAEPASWFYAADDPAPTAMRMITAGDADRGCPAS